MKRSVSRNLTTHTGSLPRPAGLLSLLNAKEAGTLEESRGFDAAVRDAVAETVRKQGKGRHRFVNDGEMSKPGYATYVKTG